MKVLVLGRRARSSIDRRGALIENAAAAGPAIGGACRDLERAFATVFAPGLREARAGTIGAAALA